MVRLKAYPDTNPFLLRKRRERLWKARESRFPSTSASLGSGLRQKQARLSPLKRFGMTKRKWFSGSHDQSGYGASEGVGDMKPVVLNLGHRRLKAIDDVPLAVRLKAYPDTTLTEDARQIPWRIFALISELFVSQVSKIARPGHAAGMHRSVPLRFAQGQADIVRG